ncbi:MAG TPA: carboxypeptidase-like regulatory domain-containing protein [Candidatus Eisenbacteria bacterium]|nr:carboxypeptidase-like regulatory domain-containing protein [Candidatus Eisenbacteria bacterium]
MLVIAAYLSGLAQSRSSCINGVVSGSGAPLRSVKVRLLREATSQVIVETETDRDGRFQVFGLKWGRYVVEFSSDGWRGRQLDIELRPDATVSVEVALIAVSRELTPPPFQVVDQDLWFGTNFTNFNMQQLPNGRNIWALLQSQEPSTVTNRFEIGGTETAVPALFSAFGASWTENQYRLNGLNVTDPYQPGLPDMNPGIDALSEFQVLTASKPAVSYASGESLELATPEPGDSLHGAAQMYISGSALQSDNVNARLRNFDFPGPEQLNSLLDGSIQLGGKLPVPKFELPFYVSVSTQQVSQNLGGFAAPIDSGVNRALVDFIPWSDQHQRIDLLYGGQHVFNSRQGAMPTVVPESTTRGNDNFNQFQARWSRPLNSASLLTASFGAVNAIVSSSFQNGVQGVSTVDLPLMIFTGPAPLATSGLRTRYEAQSTLQFMRNGRLGSHSVSVGFDWSRGDIVQRWYAMGNVQQVLVNGAASELVRWNTPTQSQQHVQNVAEYVQDSWRPWRWLSLPVGLRIDTSTGDAKGASKGINWTTVQPRVGLVIPVWLPGMVLQGSWSRYGHVLQGRYLDYGNPVARGEQVYGWQDLNGDGIVQPQEIGPLLRVGGGPYSAIAANLTRPYTDEISVGVQQNISNRITAYIRFFRRDDHRLIALQNTGVPFSQYAPVQYPDPGNDGIAGTSDDQIVTLYNENPSALGHDFLLLSNPGFDASYKGFQALVLLRLKPSWQFSANFTAGQTLAHTSPGNPPVQNDTGVVDTLAIDPNTLVMSPGRTYFDRGYMGKITAYYAAPRGFYLSAVATYFDGAPFGRLLFVNGFNQGPFFVRATPVGHPGGFQTQLNATIDVRLARDFRLSKGMLSAYLDVFNIMNWSSNTQESDLTGPSFLLRVPLAVEAPRTFRFGAAWRF